MNNQGDIESILRAISAIPLHLAANDFNAETNHRFCPSTEGTWCQHQLFKLQGKPLPHHPNYLTSDLSEYIQKLFSDYKYNSPDFIKKICDGKISNNNESLHHILFQMVKKTEQVSETVMRLGSALAVIRFNDGFNGYSAAI